MRLLIIGNLTGDLAVAAKIAMDRGAKVAHSENTDQAIKALLKGEGADIIFIEVTQDIAGLVSRLELERIAIPVIACGDGQNSQLAVSAIQAGAKDYLPLPPDSDLIAAIFQSITRQNKALIAKDPAMRATITLADQIAGSDASILITGESGTGKEVMARYIHENSRRKDKIFISINCAAIPENLLESELFGHEKGAFTGASSRRIGKFEEASGGTLLLDEISEMDMRLQAKLLRALQERVIDRVGGSQPIPVDLRILATSNRNLNKSVADGHFRQDLLFRLNVVNLNLPPLRQRQKDILELATHFIEKYSSANGIEIKPLSMDAAELLLKNPWPGNVRELENTMHRAVLLATGPEISASAIRMPDGQAPLTGVTTKAEEVVRDAQVLTNQLVGQTVANVERDLILNTLDHCYGNRTRAAHILGISIRTLRNKLRLYSDQGIDIPMPGEPRGMVG